MRLAEDYLQQNEPNYIRQKSEPCMIHRSAIMNHMYMEILDFFLNSLDNSHSCHDISELPERLISYIDVEGYHSVTATQSTAKA